MRIRNRKVHILLVYIIICYVIKFYRNYPFVNQPLYAYIIKFFCSYVLVFVYFTRSEIFFFLVFAKRTFFDRLIALEDKYSYIIYI